MKTTMANGYRLVVAGDRRSIEDAERVRFKVYAEQEGLLRPDPSARGLEIESRDFSEATTHLLVYRGSEPVGTLRLCLPELGASVDRPRGFEIERHFELEGFNDRETVVSEVTRYCVLRRYRGGVVASLLYAGLRAESARRGVTHWVALATLGTASAPRAALVHEAILAQGLFSTRFVARPRHDVARREPPRCHELEPEQHGLPRTLALFLTKMGGRGMGSPVYDQRFHVFALPIVVDLHDDPSRGSRRGFRRPRQARVWREEQAEQHHQRDERR